MVTCMAGKMTIVVVMVTSTAIVTCVFSIMVSSLAIVVYSAAVRTI